MKPINKNSIDGFTLIEVLIAMVILAIGALGVAALQFKGLKYSTDANIRSNANFLAYDIADSIRINRDNVGDYVQDYESGSAHGDCDNNGDADDDLDCWYDRVDEGLPPGSDANITGPDANGLYTITLSWDDREGETHTLNYTFRP